MTVKSELAPIVERLGYVAAILDANASKFTVPDHIPAKARTVREAADTISDLVEELQALVTAVRFTDPPKMFNRVLCHEARVPVAFVDGAEAAIARARDETTDA